MNDIPEFPNITELRITAQVSIPTDTIGASIAKFVAKCSRIEYLSIDINKQVRLRKSSRNFARDFSFLRYEI